MAGKAAIERDSDNPDGGTAYLTRLRSGLLGVMRQSPLTPAERADAGRMLGVLGDPRVEVLDPLLIEWCAVPAGPFLMGDDEGEDNARPQHTVDIPYTYKISRYPVTNAHYQHFVEDGGYANAAYWPEAIAHKRWQAGKLRIYTYRNNEWHEEWVDAPADFGEPLTLSNHPVVGVSWYEALAFARWLCTQLHETGTLPKDWTVTLPSEAEWEKAARGPAFLEADPEPALPEPVEGRAGSGRCYPWGDTLTPDHANLQASGIGHSSAVGVFPKGRSPFGVEELIGNVWEWTRSLWGRDGHLDFSYPYQAEDGREDLMAFDRPTRVLRGNSLHSGGFSDCTLRRRNSLGSRYGYYGFRIVVSPSTSSN